MDRTEGFYPSDVGSIPTGGVLKRNSACAGDAADEGVELLLPAVEDIDRIIKILRGERDLFGWDGGSGFEHGYGPEEKRSVPQKNRDRG